MLKLSNRRTAVAIAAATLALPSLCGAGLARAQGPPQIPATFYGTVTVAGAPAPAGALVRAFVNGLDCTQSDAKGATIEAGVARYVLTVVHDTQQAGCGKEGAEVQFTVDGVEASPRARWVAAPQQVNLSVEAAATEVPESTPTPIPPGQLEPPDEADDDASPGWWLIAGGAALAAVGAAAAVLFWRKRQGKG